MLGWQAGAYLARKLERDQNWTGAISLYRRMIAAGSGSNPNINFRLGHAYFSINDFQNAEKYITKAINIDPQKPTWHYRLGFIKEKTRNFSEAITAYSNALQLDTNAPEYHYRIAKSHAQLREVESALNHFHQACIYDPTDSRYRSALIKYASKHAPAWQQIGIYAEAMGEKRDQFDLLLASGKAKISLSLYMDALNDLKQCVAIKPSDFDATYLYAHVNGLTSNNRESKKHFATIRDETTDLNFKRFGPGAVAEKRGDWRSAAYYYSANLDETPLDAELHYKLGFAQDRNYEWSHAEESLKKAVRLNPSHPNWHYRLGFVLERQHKWEESAASYQYAVEISPAPSSYWRYRLGTVLKNAGELTKSAEAFLRMNDSIKDIDSWRDESSARYPSEYESQIITEGLLAISFAQDASTHEVHSKYAAQAGLWDVAAKSMETAVDRSLDHKSQWYQKLGEYHYLSGSIDKAVTAFANQRVFQRADGIDPTPYFASSNKRHSMEYVEYLDHYPIRQNTIMYESHFGNSIDCNPLAICEAALNDDGYNSFTHIWVINDQQRIPSQLRGRANVFFVSRESDAYRRFLATSKYLVNNVTFPSYFIRRAEQQYLNTWHGTPLKTLGKDIQTGFMEHANVSRNFIQATHIQAPNQHTNETLIQKYDIEGLSSAKVISAGTPRIDKVLTSNEAAKKALKKKLGIPEDSKKPVVLYAPTWRGSLTSKHFDDARLLGDLKELQSEDRHFLFRAHHMTEELLHGHDLSDVLVPRDIDTNDLLAVVDILITDYSSIFFDFLPTGRKIIFYTYDLDEYIEERGLYFEMSNMPGVSCDTIDKVTQEIEEQSSVEYVPDAGYNDAVEEFCPMEDGSASQRVLGQFIHGDSSATNVHPTDKRKHVVFHQSLMPNGITTSFINLLNAIDPSKYRVSFLFDPKSISSDPARWENFQKIPAFVQLIGRVGGMNRSLEEQWLSDRVDKYHDVDSEEVLQLYRDLYSREARRIFGESSTIDNVVEYDGYAPFWLALLGNLQVRNRRITYLHNDMQSEKDTKYPYLSLSFGLYNFFDRIVSVSLETHRINSRNLSIGNEIPVEKFDYVDNPIDVEEIRNRSKEPVDKQLSDWLGSTRDYFLNIGRLSPEKDQIKLIEAFRTLVEDGFDSKLIILGDGPLRMTLQSAIDVNGLQGHVLMAGRISNPFPLMASARAFVLSSNHEGQPMVLLEAMALGTSIIATDIVANRGVVRLGYGNLVENSQTGLNRGMNDLLLQPSNAETFSASSYISNSIKQFDNIVSSNTARNVDLF